MVIAYKYDCGPSYIRRTPGINVVLIYFVITICWSIVNVDIIYILVIEV